MSIKSAISLTLIFPPLADAAQPYSSLPALTAFLKKQGRRNVNQVDTNIEFIRYILERKTIQRLLISIDERLRKLDNRDSLQEEELEEYKVLMNACLKGPFVVETIEKAVEDLKDAGCYADPRRLNRGKRLIFEAMEIFSAYLYPLQLKPAQPGDLFFKNLTSPGKWGVDVDDNPFYWFFREYTLANLKKLSPDVIGISITYGTQIMPAVILSGLIKEFFPGIPVIWGGNMVTYWYDGIESCRELFNWCDYMVPFEGESALNGLLNSLEKDYSVEEVPNLVYICEGKIKKNPIKVEDIDALPTPDYRGLPLNLYLSLDTVFLLYTSRGCYWSGCHFCSISASLSREYRRRSPGNVYNDIRVIKERHNGRYIAFADDCVSPVTLEALSAMVNEKGPEIYWQCEVRFEKSLTSKLLEEMRKAGCLNLIFGLESYSAKVLRLMNKGIDNRHIDRIINDCRKYGIACNLQFFFGFPGETLEDAELTVDFIKKQAHGGVTFSFGTFEIQKGSMVEKYPEKFNIDRIDRSGGALANRFNYSPKPDHAEKIKKKLQTQLYGNCKYSYTGLSITAHTLIFLRTAGIEALGQLYDKNAQGKGETEEKIPLLLEWKLAPRRTQTLRAFAHLPSILNETKRENIPGTATGLLLYDHTIDRSVMISPLLAWILKRLDGSTTSSRLIASLREQMEAEENAIEDMTHLVLTLQKGIEDLFNKGFLCNLSNS